MSVRDAVNFRRAVRRYRDEPLDADVVRDCLRLAQLAPSSSNMQLWQVFHVTSPAMLRRLTEACLGQGTARTAQQMVVFVTRQDLYREHACQVFAQESANVRATSPKERHDHRLRRLWLYYARVMPLYYARFHGAAGIARKGLASAIGLVRPMVREVTESDANAVVHKSCALAAQTFMLAMAEVGYDTCPVEGLDSKQIAKILDLPRGARVTMVVTCGKRAPGGIWGERQRLPFEEFYSEV